tara:strand:- start:958 stop:1398 length:441 start_codon:yes stop_codon:yes gene_type:complete
MPKVGDKEFSYDSKGIKEAAKESMETGIPISNGAERTVQTYAGGGKTGYNIPMYKKGGMVKDEDISVAASNEAKVKKYEDRFKAKEQKEKAPTKKGAKRKAKPTKKTPAPRPRKKTLAEKEGLSTKYSGMSKKEIMELMDSQPGRE